MLRKYKHEICCAVLPATPATTNSELHTNHVQSRLKRRAQTMLSKIEALYFADDKDPMAILADLRKLSY
jgi:hypothetical protein